MGKKQRSRKQQRSGDAKPRETVPAPVTDQQRRWLWGLVLLAVLVLVAFANSLLGDFVWDDRMLILNDPATHSLANIPEFFTKDFFHRQENELGYGYYRPIIKTSYAVGYALFGRKPLGYHVVNLLIHLGCTLLVALLLRRLTRSPVAALLAAAMFAVHPIHTECVSWIAGRTDLLAFLFTAASLLLFLQHVAAQHRDEDAPGLAQEERTGKPAQDGWSWAAGTLLALSLTSFTVAMLAKEMSVVLVPWLVLACRFVARRSWRLSLLAAVPHTVVVGLYAVVRLWVLQVPPPGQPEFHTLAKALLSMPALLVRYLGWLCGLGERNAYVQQPYTESLGDWRFWVTTFVLVVVVIALWLWGRRRREVLALAGMLATSFGPIAGIVRAAGPPDMGNMMAERFCYFPSFPFVALVVLAGLDLIALTRRRALLLCSAVFAIWMVWATYGTITRNQDWRDRRTFLEKTLSQSPTAALLWTNLANLHLSENRLDEASQALQHARALAPADYSVIAAMATWYVVSGRPADAVPIQEQIAEIAFRSRPIARSNLAYLYRITGRYHEAEQILLDLVEQGHGYAAVLYNLAEINRAKGKAVLARRYYRESLALDPGDLYCVVGMAELELAEGNLELAETIYRQAIQSFPGSSKLYNNLATVRDRQGDKKEALGLLEQAIAINPTTIARINRARLLVTVGRIDEAVAELERAVADATDAKQRQLAEQELHTLRRSREQSPPQAPEYLP